MPSCYSAHSFLRAHCSYILLKKNYYYYYYFKAFSLFFSLKNIFYFSLFYSFLLLYSDLPFLSSSLFFFFFLALWNWSPRGSPLKAISRLGFEPMKLLPFQFFSVGFDGGSRWQWFVSLIWRHHGEIGECVGWLFRLQFCFDDLLFLLDSCSFALFLLDDCGFALFCFVFVFFFPSCSGLDQPPVSNWLRFCFCSGWLFLWWLGGGWL